MKHDIDSRRIDAFIDGELDLASQLEIEGRMRVDAELRERIEGARQLQAAVREQADYHEMPAALRERLDALAAPKAAQAAAPARAAALVERWFGWRQAAASLALVGIGALTMHLATVQTSRNDRLLDEVVASHVRSTLGQHLVDVASSDHHTVKPWFQGKLDFSPPVADLSSAGFPLVGGRLDTIDGRRVAALVYQRREHLIDVFVSPGRDGVAIDDRRTIRGFQERHWIHADLMMWAVSDLNDRELAEFVQAFESATQ